MSENKTLIEMNNFTLSYKDKKNNTLIHLLEDTNFEVKKGEIVIILGKNGSGKTTLIEKILNDNDAFLTNNDGSEFNIEFADELCECDIRKLVAYSKNDLDDSWYREQIKGIIKTSIDEYKQLNNYESNIDDHEYVNMLAEKYYGDKRKLKQRYGRSSSGERKKANIISALARQNAPLYIFDEPVNCLDTETIRIFRDEVQRLAYDENGPKAGVVIITHCRIFNKYDRVYRIENKKLNDITSEYKPYNCIDF